MAACSLHATGASAQRAEDQAGARVLFDEAKRLMKSGDYGSACPRLEAASRLYAGSGILLNLGDCFEHVGRTASAWTTFGEAASAASRLGRDGDVAEAKRRQAALEPKLVRLLIQVKTPPPEVVIKRDGKVVDSAMWGIPIPVDAGTHVVSAEAAQRQPWSISVTVTEPGKTTSVDVPELTAVAAPAAAPEAPKAREQPAPAEPRSYWTTRRVLGAGFAGAGVVAAGLGAVLGLSAKSDYDHAAAESGAARHDDSVRAVHKGNLATIVVVVGGVIAGAGLTLWLTAPSASTTMGTNGRDLVLQARF